MNGGQPIGILSDSLKCWGRITLSPPDILYLSGVGHKAARQRRGLAFASGFGSIESGMALRGITERIAAIAKIAGRRMSGRDVPQSG